MTHLDGNALAGVLADFLNADVTAAVGRCRNCHLTFEIARANAFITAMGAVMRCRHCDSVLAVIVEKPRELLVNLSGLDYLMTARS